MIKEEETVAPSLAQNYDRQARDQAHPKGRAQPSDGCLVGIGEKCGPMYGLVGWGTSSPTEDQEAQPYQLRNAQERSTMKRNLYPRTYL